MGEMNRRDFLKIGVGAAAGIALGPVLKIGAQGEAPETKLPADLLTALHQEFGEFTGTVDWKQMIDTLSKASVVAIGESHTDGRDMKTAGDVIEGLRFKRKLVIAVERFSQDLNQKLNAMYHATNGVDKQAMLYDIFREECYAAVWQEHRQEAALNGPQVTAADQKAFEDLMTGCTLAGMPIVGIDVSYEDRKNGQKMDDPSRNAAWAQIIHEFKKENPEMKDCLFVVIGGKRHMGGGETDFPGASEKEGLGNVIAVGQRSLGNASDTFSRVEALAKQYHAGDIILQNPTVAGIKNSSFIPGKGFWIAVHPTV